MTFIIQGSYHIRAALYNGNDEAEHRPAFLCIDGWLIFADVPDDHYACASSKSDTLIYAPDEKNIVSQAFESFFNSLLGVETADHIKAAADNL